MADYAGRPVTFLAVNYFTSASIDPVRDVETWISNYGWTFNVATDHPQYGVYDKFDSRSYDAFFVIDAAGKVTLRLDAPNTQNSAFPLLRGAIDQALATVPVEGRTWGRIKQLFGGRE